MLLTASSCEMIWEGQRHVQCITVRSGERWSCRSRSRDAYDTHYPPYRHNLGQRPTLLTALKKGKKLSLRQAILHICYSPARRDIQEADTLRSPARPTSPHHRETIINVVTCYAKPARTQSETPPQCNRSTKRQSSTKRTACWHHNPSARTPAAAQAEHSIRRLPDQTSHDLHAAAEPGTERSHCLSVA